MQETRTLLMKTYEYGITNKSVIIIRLLTMNLYCSDETDLP